jgi:hypothetical protein
MGLPKIDQPRYKHHLVGMDKDVYFRGFTTREQKILLQAKQDENKEHTLEAIKQIIELCTFGDIQADDLAFFDIEDLFLRIRAKSVSEVIDVKYKVKNPDGTYQKKSIELSINLDKVKVETPEGHTNKIMITDQIGVVLKYPSLLMLDHQGNEIDMIKQCVDYIFDQDEVYYIKDVSSDEFDAFFDDLDVEAIRKMSHFFNTMPRLRHQQIVHDENGKEMELVFEGLNDFFPSPSAMNR